MPMHAVAAARTAPSTLLRSDLIPLLISYVLFLALLATWSVTTRRPDERQAPPPPSGREPSFGRLVRYAAITAVGGYVAFLVLVLGYYAAIARQTPWFLRQAVSGGAVMAFLIGLPALLLAGWLEDRVRSR